MLFDYLDKYVFLYSEVNPECKTIENCTALLSQSLRTIAPRKAFLSYASKQSPETEGLWPIRIPELWITSSLLTYVLVSNGLECLKLIAAMGHELHHCQYHHYQNNHRIHQYQSSSHHHHHPHHHHLIIILIIIIITIFFTTFIIIFENRCRVIAIII